MLASWRLSRSARHVHTLPSPHLTYSLSPLLLAVRNTAPPPPVPPPNVLPHILPPRLPPNCPFPRPRYQLWLPVCSVMLCRTIPSASLRCALMSNRAANVGVQMGYSYRLSFEEFVRHYKILAFKFHENPPENQGASKRHRFTIQNPSPPNAAATCSTSCVASENAALLLCCPPHHYHTDMVSYDSTAPDPPLTTHSSPPLHPSAPPLIPHSNTHAGLPLPRSIPLPLHLPPVLLSNSHGCGDPEKDQH